MAIDITKPESFKKLNIDDLINDAVERNDVKALEWLQQQSNEKKQREKDGVKTEVRKSIVEIRAAYVKKFLGYKTQGSLAKERLKAQKEAKLQKALDDKFAAAFAKIRK